MADHIFLISSHVNVIVSQACLRGILQAARTVYKGLQRLLPVSIHALAVAAREEKAQYVAVSEDGDPPCFRISGYSLLKDVHSNGCHARW